MKGNEIFIDEEYKEFLTYVIDYKNKKILPYICYSIPDIEHFVNDIKDKFNIEIINTYCSKDILFYLRDLLCLYVVEDKDCIYEWKMYNKQFDNMFKSMKSIEYYIRNYDCEFISEKDYVEKFLYKENVL